MVTARRFLPLLLGVVAAVVIAAVAAVALPGAFDASSPAVPSVEESAHSAGALPANVAAKEEAPAEKPTVPTVDPVKVAAAHDSFPAVPKSVRDASVDKQAERVAAKLAEEEAEAARKRAEEKAEAQAKAQAEAEAKAKAQAEAEAKAAAQADRKDEKEGKAGTGDQDAGDKPPKDEKDKKDEKEQPTKPAWWPEHVWGHVVSCAVAGDGASVVGTWDVWLKHGGDWAFTSASPAPAEVSGTDGDKVKLTYPDVTASLHKEHDGKAKFRGGPISVTVQDAGDPASQKTFTVDLWVVTDADGRCPA